MYVFFNLYKEPQGWKLQRIKLRYSSGERVFRGDTPPCQPSIVRLNISHLISNNFFAHLKENGQKTIRREAAKDRAWIFFWGESF